MNIGYRHGIFEQLARMGLTAVGAVVMGDAWAQSDAAQLAIGGIVSAVGYVWWAIREYRNRKDD